MPPPQLLMCYLCGQQFGTTSLNIHIPQCYVKRMKVWNNGDPKERGPKPKNPDEVNTSGATTMSKEEFNNAQYDTYADNMAQCDNCGRKFQPDRLVVHQRSCRPGASGGGSKSVAGKAPPSSQGKRPPTGESKSGHHLSKGPAPKPSFLMCYLCGQQFGTTSLGIHIPQCYEKKMKVWNNGDPKERGPKPKNPDEVDFSGAGTQTKEEFNNAQYSEFTENMAQCDNCGRKFLPDRLVVHLRSCKPGASGGGSKSVAGKAPPSSQGKRPPTGGGMGGGGGGGGSSSPPKTKVTGPAAQPQLLICYLCGQQFGTTSLGIHIPQCYVKKMKVWENTDPKERGPKPKHPDEVDTSGAGKMSKEEFNNQQAEQFTANMAQCEHCGRKFLPDRLVVHQKSCKPGASGGGSKPVAKRSQPTDGGGSGSPLKGPSPSKQAPSPSAGGGDSGYGGGGGGGARGGSSAGRNPIHKFDPPQQQNKTNRNPLAKGAGQEGADKGRTCSGCQAVEYEGTAKFCKDCGTPYPKPPPPPPEEEEEEEEEEGPPTNCPDCDADLEPDAKFCSNCGTSMKAMLEQLQKSKKKPSSKPPPSQSGGGGAGAAAAESMVLGKDCPNCGYSNEEDAQACSQCECDLEEFDEEEYANAPPPPLLESTRSGDGGAGASRGGGGGGGGKAWNRTQSQPTEHNNIGESQYGGSQYGGGGGDDGGGGGDDGPDDRVCCSNCGRKFAAESIAKHERICNKTKKRKVFDPSKMRAKGSDIGEFSGAKSAANAEKPKNTWKNKSNDFRNAMKASRQMDEAKKNGGPLPEPVYSENAHYTACPHCGRRFAPDVADRHIPRCKTTVNKPKPPPKKKGRY